MAMRKIAYARVVEPCLTVNKWQATRTAAKHKAASNLIEKATEIFGESFNPDDYLLTHATIVSSVTTNPVENVRLGSMVDEYGQTINRIYPDYRITPDTEKYINNNLDAFSRGVLLKSYKTFIGARNHVEHDQRVSETKGRIIDAVVRDIGETLYVDILVATDRTHKDLIDRIESGEITGMSMGCNIQFSQCTKCGHVAYDDTDQCSHVRYQKGQKFTDEQGKSKIIAELCGHHTVDPNAGVTFIEASWVADPAFKGAVVRNILTGESVSEGAKKKAQQILSSPPREWIEGQERKKASSYRNAFDFGGDDAKEGESEDAPAEDAPAETEEKKDPISVVVEAYKMKVRQMAAEELNNELKKPEVDKQVSDTAPASMNESLIKEANSTNSAFSSVSQFISKVASSEKDFLFRVASYHRALGIEMDPKLYWAASKNPITLSDTPGTYLKACQFDLKRKVTKPEAEFLIRVGHLIRRFNDSRDPRNSNK
jgi:hypothetical protein